MRKILSCVLCFFLPAVMAATPAETVQSKLNAIKTMKANFSQVVTAEQREISRSAGSMALMRPGKFRWQTRTPMAQIVVADGQKLWVYDVELEQVTVKKQEKGLGDTAALFLSGYNDRVARDFSVKHRVKAGRDYFDLNPKNKQGNFSSVILVFAAAELQGITFFDQLGQKTEVKLSQIKNNAAVSSDLFKFSPPRGVDVLEQ